MSNLGMWPFTPSDLDISRDIVAVHGSIAVLNSDIEQSSVATEFKQAWAIFLQEWTIFQNHFKDLTAWMAPSSETWNQVQAYKERVATWSDAFKKVGGVTTVAPPRPKYKWTTEDKLIVAGLGMIGIAAAAMVTYGIVTKQIRWWGRKRR